MEKRRPHRTCVGCRQTLEKRELIRLVRTKHGVEIDSTGRKPGRGAYLHQNPACWEIALKGSLAKALRTEIDHETRDMLEKYMTDEITIEQHG